MKSDIKARWVKALRSGDYEQGRETLHYANKFCCLGVLCEVLSEDGLVKSDETGGYVFVSSDGNVVSDTMEDALDSEVLDYVGLTNRQQTTLIALNDEAGADFPTIALVLDSFA